MESSNTLWVTIEREIIFENWVTADWWNRQRILIHGWRMKSIEKTESSLTHGIVSENCIATDPKSSAKTEWLVTLKWPLKYEWQLTYGVDSVNEFTATHKTYSKNRFMFDAWNRQTHYASVDPSIVSENWVTVEREIIFENWVKADGWNRQRILIHGWRMISKEKTESSLTHGIVSENCVTTDKKSSAKKELLLTLKSPLKYEWQLTYGVGSVKEFTSEA
jgi:hypothetical protein